MQRKAYLLSLSVNLFGSVLYNVCLARGCLPPYSVASPVVNTAQILSGLFDGKELKSKEEDHRTGLASASTSASESNASLLLGVALVIAGVCVLAMEAKG